MPKKNNGQKRATRYAALPVRASQRPKQNHKLRHVANVGRTSP